MKTTTEQKPKTAVEYIQQPSHCPYCGSDEIEGRFVEVDGASARQEVGCGMCERKYVDVYRLVGYMGDMKNDGGEIRTYEGDGVVEMLEAMIEHEANLNKAFFVDGTSKAMHAAMQGQKTLLNSARAAVKEWKETHRD